MFWCKLFGHHYSITSAMGNYAFCSRCGDTLTIKDPYALSPGERRYMHGMLFEMTEFGLEEVKIDVKKDSREVDRDISKDGGAGNGDYSVQSTDPGERY
tara:strand:- start:6651 stop:6947 length:297 start_codon:yes stop_codon:yes gene_type:complete